MASAKKGKKNKGKTLALSDFLQETPGTVATMPIRKSAVNWADEVEDNHDSYDSRPSKANVILPTAPKASRDFDDIIDKVPQDPPFIAYLTNLPYDVDENEISFFFKNMKIANMRIPKDERPGEMPKLKGFGYVEFEDRESLLNALVIPDTTIKNRRIRIEIATDYDNDKRRGGGRMDMSRDRSGRSDSSMGDWRSGPRQESNSDLDRRGFSRDRDRDRDRDDSSGAWRGGPRAGDRDRGGFREERDRDREDKPFMSRRFEDRAEDKPFMSRRFDDKSEDKPFMSRRFEDKAEDKPYMSRRFEDKGSSRNGGFSRNREESSDAGSEPRRRQKLVLAPRTKPVEGEPDKVASSTSIFGDAKPVDTSARERQIEERLAKDHDPPPPKRELSKERRDTSEKETVGYKERREADDDREEIISSKAPEAEKKSEDREKSSYNPKSDVNGVVDKSQQQPQQKRISDQEKKESVKSDAADKHKSEVKKREDKKEKIEKEMPQLKKAEPPNFNSSNKFAFLEMDDNSD